MSMDPLTREARGFRNAGRAFDKWAAQPGVRTEGAAALTTWYRQARYRGARLRAGPPASQNVQGCPPREADWVSLIVAMRPACRNMR
jgi:hypothetical protein